VQTLCVYGGSGEEQTTPIVCASNLSTTMMQSANPHGLFAEGICRGEVGVRVVGVV